VQVVFICGPAASGKHTIGARLSRRLSLPLFHNHLTVDLAKMLFEFGTVGYVSSGSQRGPAADQRSCRYGGGAGSFRRCRRLVTIDTSTVDVDAAVRLIEEALSRVA
jgi:hypothetical protein